MYSEVLLFLCFIVIVQVDAAKIFATFPTPSFSHQVVFRPLIMELVHRGHEVTVVTPNPMFKNEKKTNLTEIDVQEFSYGIMKAGMEANNFKFGERQKKTDDVNHPMVFITHLISEQLKMTELQRLINDKNVKFDLIIAEAWTRQVLIFSHLFKAPVILMSSFGFTTGDHKTYGTPSHPILYPSGCRQRLYNLTFWEKFNEIYMQWAEETNFVSSEKEEIHQFRNILGRHIPYYDELRNNIDMVFLNMHPVLSDNLPWPPNVISIWGIYKNIEKPLPKDLQNYLDNSKNGVIFVSFGTNARSSLLPKKFIETLLNVFSKLPYDVLWKWETDELPGKSANIKTSKWLPQSDLLKHPKVKLFITQGGLQSTDEAVLGGVPMVGIPMLGDQWYNVEKYVYHGIGVQLEMPTLTENELATAIATVINDESYRKNVQRLRSILYDQPESGLDRAVWWTEYVLRHGGAKHLRSPAANMSWAQYYEIEFVLKLLSLVLGAFILSLTLVCYVWKYFSRIIKNNKVKVS